MICAYTLRTWSNQSASLLDCFSFSDSALFPVFPGAPRGHALEQGRQVLIRGVAGGQEGQRVAGVVLRLLVELVELVEARILGLVPRAAQLGAALKPGF